MSIKHRIRQALWSLGYDIQRFTPELNPLARRKQIIESCRIDTMLDIGANAGQFALQTRSDIGYAGRILSFEPLSSAFKRLEAHARHDDAWEVFNLALGDADGTAEINISANSYSSSLLAMLPSHARSAPASGYVGTEVINVKRLDAIFDDLCAQARHVYMKLDTQGFEEKVLQGARESLDRIDTIQMEMSLVPLYEGELLFPEMCGLMKEKGYTLIAIENGFTDPSSGQLLQVDGIFHRL